VIVRICSNRVAWASAFEATDASARSLPSSLASQLPAALPVTSTAIESSTSVRSAPSSNGVDTATSRAPPASRRLRADDSRWARMPRESMLDRMDEAAVNSSSIWRRSRYWPKARL
jgi:hypothetical protein